MHPSKVRFEADPTPTKARVVLIGDSGVGKTSLVKRILDHSFKPTLTQTIGVDFRILRLRTTETRCPVKFEIWDTAGEERFLSVTSLYFRDAPLILLCYDRTEFKTLTDLRTYWLPHITRDVDLSRVVILLVATKYDVRLPKEEEDMIREELEDYWIGEGSIFQDPSARGDRFVGSLWAKYSKPASLHHVITSAKEGNNIAELFQLGADALEAKTLLEIERPFKVKKSGSSCCVVS